MADGRRAGPPPQTDLPPVPPNPPAVTAVPDQSRAQVNVNLAETLGLDRFNPDYYPLELGDHVLGGGFYATRLYRDLRENSGLVYFVGSSFEIGKTRGIYTVNYACDPQNVSKARGIVVRDLKDMQNTAASADELTQAKAMLLRQVPLSEASVDSIAEGWIGRSAIGLPLDEPEIASQTLSGTNADQVKAAFAKWVRPDDLVQVTQGSEPAIGLPGAYSGHLRVDRRAAYDEEFVFLAVGLELHFVLIRLNSIGVLGCRISMFSGFC